MSLICSFCCDDYEVNKTALPGGGLRYECTRSSNHPGGRPWVKDISGRDISQAPSGPRAFAGDKELAPAILACFTPGEPWIEYGIVEHRHAANHPDAFRRLVEEKGHAWWRPPGDELRRTPSADGGEMTASKYLVRTLSALAGSGDLCRKFAKGTGIWSYNSTISYWALAPAPAVTNLLTYQQFAIREHLDDDRINQYPRAC